jgi:hypothetical protein
MRLFSCFLLLSIVGTILRPLLPKLLPGSSLEAWSCLTTGCRILDFFLTSAAALATSSAFSRANVQGLILTAPEFFFFSGSSLSDLFPSELTEPVSVGTTLNYNSVPPTQKKRVGKNKAGDD